MSDFDDFWAAYPRRESRTAAMREYIYARRTVSAEDILAGLARYNEHLPREVRFIKKPANWLRDGDWDNEYEVNVREQFPDCDHEPKCANKRWCAALRWKAAQGA